MPRDQRALNQKTTSHLSYEAFLNLANALGCAGVEPRNDLGRPLFDGIAAAEAGEMARERGLRLLGLSEVYPFNDWSGERASAVQALIDAAVASGAETFSLIPRADGKATEEGVRQTALRHAIREILPMLEDCDVLALIEPIGFASSSLNGTACAISRVTVTGMRLALPMLRTASVNRTAKSRQDPHPRTIVASGACVPSSSRLW